MQKATCLPATPAVRLERDTQQLLEYTKRAAWFRMQGYTSLHYQQVRSLLEEYSGARHTQNFLTKSDDFIYNLLDHSLELRPGIASFEGTNTVVFDDGSRADVDYVVWCTGYQPKVPFLSDLLDEDGGGNGNAAGSTGSGDSHLDGQELFKNVFHPKLGDSFAFIGFARPQLGAMPPLAELQARWFGAVLDSEAKLPTAEEMAAEMVADREQYGSRVFAHRLRSSVDFGRYTADVARRAGCFPDIGLRTFFSDFALWQAFWFGPVLPQAYRIDDAGERGAEARARLKNTYLTFFTRQ
jgi:dimethylaniline monooxygenase (N-oxide forming)